MGKHIPFVVVGLLLIALVAIACGPEQPTPNRGKELADRLQFVWNTENSLCFGVVTFSTYGNYARPGKNGFSPSPGAADNISTTMSGGRDKPGLFRFRIEIMANRRTDLP